MKIISVVGARPNFMKIAPFIHAIRKYNDNSPSSHHLITHLLVHTGQHYDDYMSKTFFEQLNIPKADINLGVGSGTHAEQVGKTMIEFERVLINETPDWVIILGDVNAILACSVTAKKEQIKCCHIEAGLRSGDMSMPEEINRLIADRISDLLLTPDLISSDNLMKEGIPEKRIRFVGNIMIDTLEANRDKAKCLNVNEIVNHNLIDKKLGTWNLEPETDNYAVLTLHRPSNVDKKEILEPIIRFLLDEVCSERILIWTMHPRTRKMLETFDLFKEVSNHKSIILLEPLSYLEMLKLSINAVVMLTDSGGLQEECTILGTPCLTLRENTERPVTLYENGGATVLVGNNIESIRSGYKSIKNKTIKPYRPELWDGHTAERCLEAILNYKD